MAATNPSTSHNADTLTEASLFASSPKADQAVTPYNRQLHLQKQLDLVLKSVETITVREVVSTVFNDLTRLCDILQILEINASEGGPLSVTSALLSLVESESKSLIRFIEKRIPKIKSIEGPLRQALDGTSFALRHELKRVFGNEPGRINQGLNKKQVRADVMRAHGLLSNCFQQSIIALAQVFKPSISAESLFDDYRDRLEQSISLIRELSSLMELARRAAENRNEEANDLLIEDLKGFCQGTIHFLMYKDWDEFEDISREVMNSHGSARHGFILHCFATYLEALISQVRMRAVLNDQTRALLP
jgi:hypothetical protein